MPVRTEAQPKKRKGKKRPKDRTAKSQPRDLVPGFASLVKRRRVELEWTQRKLSHESGTSPMFISDLENENRSPSLHKASKVARALGLVVSLAEPTKLAV